MKNFFVLGVCWFAFNAEAGCSSDPEGKAPYPTRTITLQKRYLQEFYYYRADHYAIVVNAETLIRRLEDQGLRRSGHADRMLQDIRNRVPTGQWKDLFALLMKDALYLIDLEILIADILEKGEAMVIDAWELPQYEHRFVPAIVMTSIDNGGCAGREFRTSNGDLLFSVRDSVTD